MMEYNDETVDKALAYLAKTDERCAKAKALVEFLAESRKSVKADLYLSATGSSSAEREQFAYASDGYKDHLEKYQAAVYDHELIRNTRDRMKLIIEVWRTKQANQRMGNV
jgi:hypothetical protein